MKFCYFIRNPILFLEILDLGSQILRLHNFYESILFLQETKHWISILTSLNFYNLMKV